MKDSKLNIEAILTDIQDDPVIKIESHLINLQDNPRLLILITHGFLELLINTLVEAKCKSGKKITSSQRDYPHSIKILILNEMNVIPDWMYRILDRLRKLRTKPHTNPCLSLPRM